METFRTHGKAQFNIEGRVVCLHVVGPWNKELVVETHTQLSNALLLMPAGPWALMVIVAESAICPPDAIEQIRVTSANEATQSGRIATAWVMGDDVEGSLLMESVLRKAYFGTNAFDVFETKDSAKNWLDVILSTNLSVSPDAAR
jgi:hypothetical protein